MELLNTEAIAEVINLAIDREHSFQLNVHGFQSLDEAIDLGEKLAGHGGVHIAHQTTCYVVEAKAGKGEVAFFVRKNQTPFD